MLQRVLSPDHLSDQTKETIKVGIGLIATMSALILGLVTASAKTSFDSVDTRIRHAAGDVISLDRTLAQYGPETAAVRNRLKHLLARRIELLWPRPESKPVTVAPEDVLRQPELVASEIRALAPSNDEQRSLKSHAETLSESLLEARWELFTGLGPSIPTPFLVALIFWLSITFASFGLFAPRNATAITVLLVCALSVGAAVALVTELETPFSGLIRVPSAPMEYALAHLNR